MIIPLWWLNWFLSRIKENSPPKILHIFLLFNVPSAMSQISGLYSFVNLDLSLSFLSWACVGKLLLYVIMYIDSKSHHTYTFSSLFYYCISNGMWDKLKVCFKITFGSLFKIFFQHFTLFLGTNQMSLFHIYRDQHVAPGLFWTWNFIMLQS